MDRRDFLKRATLTSGALLTSSSMIGSIIKPSKNIDIMGGNVENVMDLQSPDRISVICNDNLSIPLSSNSNDNYTSGDICVNVKCKKGIMHLNLFSAHNPVKFVIATWEKSCSSSCNILGDHWERGYGDLEWKSIDPVRIMPWYFIEYDGDYCLGMGVKTGCNAFCSWRVSSKEITLIIDVRNGTDGVELKNRTLHMADVVCSRSNEGESPYSYSRKFCALMCDSPRLPKEPVYGINDWYFAYGNNSDELIMQTVGMMEDLIPDNGNRPYCLIDAGWGCIAPGHTSANCWSDNFYTPGPKFSDMGNLAERIKTKGMRPGLWMRPLCASNDAKENILLPSMEKYNGEKGRILDPTIPENLAYLSKCFETYHHWGYQMVKHDFTTYDIFGKWGFEMFRDDNMTMGNWHFYNRNITNAEIVLQLYRHIRKVADDIAIIGCNTISHLAAGLFELQRTGDDTSGKEWSRTLKMGVNTLAFRMPQHMSFYAADPDCVGLTTQINWELNKQWMELIAYSGSPLFISAQPEAMGAPQRDFIKKCFAVSSTNKILGEPLDWMTNITPSKWLLRGNYREFEWNKINI